MVAVAIAGSSIVSAGIGAISSSIASSKQADAARAALKLQKSMFDTSVTGLQPYNQMGQQDFSAYQNLLGLGPKGAAGMQSQLESMPGYQFTLGQGLQSTQNSYAARGLGTSGAALKGAAQYATGLANANYGTYANSLLAGSQLGETAAGNIAAAAGAFATPIGNTAVGIGNAQAAGINGIGNALSNGVNGIGSAYLLSSLLGGGNSGGYTGGFVPVTPSANGTW